MKVWNCFAIASLYGEVDSTESYGVFTSRGKALAVIYKDFQINKPFTECGYNYHWELSHDNVYKTLNNEIYQQEITLKNIASNDEETVCFIITEEEIDKGV